MESCTGALKAKNADPSFCRVLLQMGSKRIVRPEKGKVNVSYVCGILNAEAT